MGNMIVDADNGVPYWIDLGAFAWGDPMLDLACLFFFCKHPIGRLLGRKLCHLRFAYLSRFWTTFEKEYCELSGLDNLSKKASRYVLLLYLVYTIGFQNYTGFVGFVFDRYINDIALRV